MPLSVLSAVQAQGRMALHGIVMPQGHKPDQHTPLNLSTRSTCVCCRLAWQQQACAMNREMQSHRRCHTIRTRTHQQHAGMLWQSSQWLGPITGQPSWHSAQTPTAHAHLIGRDPFFLGSAFFTQALSKHAHTAHRHSSPHALPAVPPPCLGCNAKAT